MLAEDLAQLVLDAERLLNAAHALSAMALDEYQRRGTWATAERRPPPVGRPGAPARPYDH